MTMHSVLAALALALPGESREEHVTVQSPAPGIHLGGTLTLPDGEGPHPAAILITGDGGHLRDQIISGCPMFRTLAERLTGAGWAVLRVDARGAGESSGPRDEEQYTPADRAQDTLGCLAFLRARADIDARRIGLIGHSQGANIAALTAELDPSVSFLVLLSAPGLPGSDVWIDQTLKNAERRGMAADVRERLRPELRRVTDFIASGSEDQDEYLDLGHAFLAVQGVAEEEITDAFIDQVIGGLRCPHMRFFFRHDPAEPLRRLRMPVLVVAGAIDEQVVPAIHLPLLSSALLAAGNPDITVRLLPDQDHFFLRAPGLEPGVHEFGRMQLAPELLEVVEDWLRPRRGN